MDGVASLLDEARAKGLTLRVDGAKLVVRGPRRAAPLVKKLLARKPEVMAALTVSGEIDTSIPDTCPSCGGKIQCIVQDEYLVWGCDASAGEHYFRKLKRESIHIPKPIAVNLTTRCFNEGCPSIVRFKQGRGYCHGCGVYQRIVE
jgi:hypothetical protein